MNTNTMPKILIVSGTNRPGSRSLLVSTFLAAHYTAQGAQASVMDLVTLSPSWFAPENYELRHDTTRPEVLQILAADGLHFVLPEYNGSFPGAVKMWIDMLPYGPCFKDRPSAFTGIGAGDWGGLRAVEQMQTIMAYRNSPQCPNRVFIREAEDHVFETHITEEYAQRLNRQADAFVDFTAKLMTKA